MSGEGNDFARNLVEEEEFSRLRMRPGAMEKWVQHAKTEEIKTSKGWVPSMTQWAPAPAQFCLLGSYRQKVEY